MYVFMDVSHIIFFPMSSSYSFFGRFFGCTSFTISKDLHTDDISCGYVKVLFMCSPRTPTDLRNCYLSVFSPWHWKTLSFMLSVLPLKTSTVSRLTVVRFLLLFLFLLPRPRPRPLWPLPPCPPDDVVSVPLLCVARLLAGSCSLIVKEEVVRGTYDLGSVTCLNCDAACADPYDRASDCLESPWIPDSPPVADGKGSCCAGGHSCGPCWCIVALTQLP
jgi:hypothetical protein